MSDPRGEAAVHQDTRRRVLAVFATQGRSIEAPAGRRTRHLTVGVVAAVLLLVGGAVSARLNPSSSSGGWSDGDIVIGRSSAGRLVSVAGVLHPLLNTASGRLLFPPSSRSRVVVVDDSAIAVARRGPALGIRGAPDVLPAPSALVQTGWLACLDGSRISTHITAAGGSAPAAMSAAERAAVVAVSGHPDELYLVSSDHRYRIPAASFPAVKQYLDQTRSPRPAPSGWVELFPLGTGLTFGSFRFGPMAAVGQPLPDALRPLSTVAMVGQLVTNADRADAPLVVVADGTVPLTAFAAAVYRATAPSDLGTPVVLTDADLARLPPSPTVGFTPADWPESLPPSGPGVGAVCAELAAAEGRSPTTHLRFEPVPFSPDSPDPPDAPDAPDAPSPGPPTSAGPPSATAAGVAPRSLESGSTRTAPALAPGSGAVVTVLTGPRDDPTVYLVDPSGSAFPVGDPAADTLARLGYSGVVAPVVPAAWVALCPAGPELDAAATQLPAGDLPTS